MRRIVATVLAFITIAACSSQKEAAKNTSQASAAYCDTIRDLNARLFSDDGGAPEDAAGAKKYYGDLRAAIDKARAEAPASIKADAAIVLTSTRTIVDVQAKASNQFEGFAAAVELFTRLQADPKQRAATQSFDAFNTRACAIPAPDRGTE